jgi:hypothetical protein
MKPILPLRDIKQLEQEIHFFQKRLKRLKTLAKMITQRRDELHLQNIQRRFSQQ